MSRFTVERQDGDNTLEKIADGKSEHLEAIRRHSPTTLEDADTAYQDFQNDHLPIVEAQARLKGQELYQTVFSTVSEKLSEHGDAHVNQLVKDHTETLEEALFGALKHYHSLHGIQVDDILDRFEDEQEKLDWLANSYSSLTGVSTKEDARIQSVLGAIRNPEEDTKISQLYTILSEEIEGSTKRIKKDISQKAFDRFLGHFEHAEILDYSLKNLPDSHEVENMAAFGSLKPEQIYQGLTVARNDGNQQDPSRSYGLRRAN